MDLKQPSGLEAELEQLEAEQRLLGELEQAGTALNELMQRAQALMLIIQRCGIGINVGSPRNAPRYSLGSVSLPEFRRAGDTGVWQRSV